MVAPNGYIICCELPNSLYSCNNTLEKNNMLKSLDIKNFTVFADASIEFSPGLNVILATMLPAKAIYLNLAIASCTRWPNKVSLVLLFKQLTKNNIPLWCNHKGLPLRSLMM